MTRKAARPRRRPAVVSVGRIRQRPGLPRQQTGLPRQRTGLPRQRPGLPRQRTGLPRQQTGLLRQRRPRSGIVRTSPSQRKSASWRRCRRSQAQLRPNATAAAIVPPTLTMNGVSHGVVVGATANGPPCVAPTEEGSIHDSSPLPPVPSDVHPNGICGPRQRSSDELHLQIFSENNKEAKIPEKRKYRCISTKINRLVIELLVKKYRLDLSNCVPAFEGRKNLYTRRELKFRELDLGGRSRGRPEGVEVRRQDPSRRRSCKPLILSCVTALPSRLTPVGRSSFKPPLPNQAHSVGGGREVWFGYYTSVRPDQWKRMLNVDMSATTFYEPEPVISFMCKILSDGRRERTLADFRDLRDFQNVRLNKELKGLRIKVTHLPYPRKYKVVRVTKEPAKNLFFDIEDGSRCSVCEIVEGQHCRKKLDENQTSEMIKRTAQPPAKRFNEIRQSVRDLVGSNDQCLREFNIKISTEPTQLKGWVLEPPSLVFENNAVTKPYEGTWELRGKHFYKAASLTRWTLLNLSRLAQRDSLDNFVKLLVRTGNELGMLIEQPVDTSSADTNRKPIRTILLEEQCKVPNIEIGHHHPGQEHQITTR
ncbi:hypothetical protein MRX96_009196 [Rhipicephalus microplus]